MSEGRQGRRRPAFRGNSSSPSGPREGVQVSSREFWEGSPSSSPLVHRDSPSGSPTTQNHAFSCERDPSSRKTVLLHLCLGQPPSSVGNERWYSSLEDLPAHHSPPEMLEPATPDPDVLTRLLLQPPTKAKKKVAVFIWSCVGPTFTPARPRPPSSEIRIPHGPQVYHAVW